MIEKINMICRKSISFILAYVEDHGIYADEAKSVIAKYICFIKAGLLAFADEDVCAEILCTMDAIIAFMKDYPLYNGASFGHWLIRLPIFLGDGELGLERLENPDFEDDMDMFDDMCWEFTRE